uniref:Enoyl reductase (ER) domain-containing protein n=1 Tax=Chaetoceros debilis TaxID=122233 RepID=A0A7S3QJL7_9STRA|mmetsp:Transcript_29033/g.44302  ORF Transcript_29033/g.44302 Transcript_29033/m.44302 type:complete len:342 (-) Transcript_29033:194-1219(-)
MPFEVPQMMKAVVVFETGDADQLSVQKDFPVPQLIEGHALVKNDYAGVNFIDTYHRGGLYPRQVPFVCGQEGDGTIAALPLGSDFHIGDRVIYGSLGSYSEYSLVPLSKLVPLPDDIDMEVAITCMVQGLTAHYLVTSAHADLIQKGEWMLIFSVGSGTCQWAAQMAKLKGYKVIGTCSKGKLDKARETHCDELIVLDEVKDQKYADYSSVDIVENVMSLTQGQGVKCILDGVGRSTSEISLKCLARRGIFVSFGNASGSVEAFPVLKLTPKSAFVTRPKLGDYVATRDELMTRMNEVFEWVRQGNLRVGIDNEFALEQAAEAHRYIEAGKTGGKLLLKIA